MKKIKKKLSLKKISVAKIGNTNTIVGGHGTRFSCNDPFNVAVCSFEPDTKGETYLNCALVSDNCTPPVLTQENCPPSANCVTTNTVP